MDRISSVLAGYQESLLPDVQRYWCENKGNPAYLPPAPEPDMSNQLNRLIDSCSTPEQPQPRKRRYQVGWIEERISNPKRERPTTCYYFGWYEMQEGTRRKLKTYVPQAQMSEVWQSCKIDKRPYTETLKLIRKSGKPRYTDVPKL